MFGTTPELKPVQLRKRMLLLESELNRAQLSKEWQAAADEMHSLLGTAKVVAWTAGAVLLVGGLTGSRAGRPEPETQKGAWLQTVLKLAQLADSILSTLRAVWPQRPASQCSAEAVSSSGPGVNSI